jgi:WbqC-like protein family
MKLAIMQPYLFPYLGYWQLMAAVDMFVILDDVNYINRGWINRNRVAVNGKPTWMTVPLVGASQNRLISEIDIVRDNGWKNKMERMIVESYAQAPEARTALPLFNRWLEGASGNLSRSLYESIKDVAVYLGITTTIIPSSSVYPKNGLKGQHRILDICQREGAITYVNPPGGRDMYDTVLFRRAGIELLFLEPNLHVGRLRSGANDGTVLSILDHMLCNPRGLLMDAVASFDLKVA